jgi:uncharacterized protein YqeY
MLIDQVKQQMFRAMKAGNVTEKEILRTAIGEVTRTGDEATDERVLQVLRKLVKSNQETLGSVTDAAQRATLEQEIAILELLLPESLGPDKIRELLEPVAIQIRAATGPGPAMGVAMKFLKSLGAVVETRDVQSALDGLRQKAAPTP